MTRRVIAQRLLTGEFLDMDVPLSEVSDSRELSGPGFISGVINPARVNDRAFDGKPILEEWSTALFLEEDGQIRNGGILESIDYQGPVASITCPGFSSYATGQPLVANYSPTKYEDPVRVFRNLWSYLQSLPNGNIGLKIHGPKTYLRLSDGEGPYNVMSYEYRDAGGELENIANIAPFDFVETHAWADANKRAISHDLTIGFPRLGGLRTDLRMVAGENVTRASTVALDGERFANHVYVLGNGEGAAMIVGAASVADGRLRRAAVVPRKAASKGLANTYSREELAARGMRYDVSEVVIREHPNARIAAIQPGDDINTSLDLPHLGWIDLPLRVLAVNRTDEEPGMATLKTMRSDFFTYAPRTSPTGKTMLVTL